MATVTETLVIPGLGAASAAVTIDLVGEDGRPVGEAYDVANDRTVVGRLIPPVTAGVWSANLTPNADLVPEGTVWRRSVVFTDGASYAASTPPTYSYAEVVGAGRWEDMLADLPASIESSALAAHIATERTVSTVASTGATEALSFGDNIHDVTMNVDCTFSFTDAAAAGMMSQMMVIVRGAHTPTWPASVVWSGGAEPTYGAPSVYEFWTVDGGTTVFGGQAGASFA